MECTQRLECTQELYDTQMVKVCPEQIGFLGICGSKHPVIKGPNKIGRDPQTCNIVLNLNSVSRQHAVINILNSREFMLMDLDSANKTKLQNKTLQPYIPHPLRNGDMVQFGDIFGVFRILEEDDDLPMTQAIDIPETPAPSRLVAKFKAPITLIPESPDVSISDKEESFNTPSKGMFQDDQKKNELNLSNSQFITPFGKSIPIQPVSSPKVDSKNSSRNSSSIGLRNNLNQSSIELHPKPNNYNIHEMDTQPPMANDSTDSIYTADTQIPQEEPATPSIHSLDTQLPFTANECLPKVQKIQNQHEMQFDLYAANKENDVSIFNADTQPFPYDKNESMGNKINTSGPPKDISKDKIAASDEELLFEDIDDGQFDDFHSQALLPPDLPIIESENQEQMSDLGKLKSTHTEKSINETISEVLETSKQKPRKRDKRIESDESTDCEDLEMAPTQKVQELPNKVKAQDQKPMKRVARIESDSSTDCEDMILTQQIPALSSMDCNEKDTSTNSPDIILKSAKRVNRIKSDSSTDCEDMIPTQVIPEIKTKDSKNRTGCKKDTVCKDENTKNQIKFEDMDTQPIEPIPSVDVDVEDIPTQIIESIENKDEDDIATQVVEEIPINKTVKKPFPDIVSPFKVPLQSLMKSKNNTKTTSKNKIAIEGKSKVNNTKYYNDTQDIFDDLCSQRPESPEVVGQKTCDTNDNEVVPCSVEDYKVGDRFARIEENVSPKKLVRADKSSSSDGDENMKKYIENLSSQDVREVIGVKTNIAKPRKFPSDASDEFTTPTKVRPFRIMDVDLPNSQEIKTSVSRNINISVTEPSSESETENSEEQYTPLLHRKKKPVKTTKVDLTKKLDIEKLPERVITRVRKPTAKIQDAEVARNILKPKFLTEQEDHIDKDIIIENITRLKNNEKGKGNKDKKNDESTDSKTVNVEPKVDSKKKATKERVKVKIERPKKKESKSKKETRISEESSKKKSLESTTSDTQSAVSSRTTRSRNKKSDSQPTEKKSISPENTKPKTTETKRTRSTKKQERSVSPEIEVRRSKRQQSAKEKRDDSQGAEELKAPKSILKKSTHEQSTVYNVSSSSADSPKNLKRLADNDSDVPSPKRTRGASGNTSCVSLRATPARMLKTQHVLFTAFPSEEVKHKLEKLGAVVVTDVTACTVVLTMQIRRTFKLLCAVGLGRPIVGPNWVQACVDTHTIVDPWLYLIRDEDAEKRFRFSLERSLTGKRNYLKGYNVSSTPSVQPNATEMKLIVESSGGTWQEGGTNWLCVSCGADRAHWAPLRRRGAILVSAELILGGVLRQKLEIQANTLKE